MTWGILAIAKNDKRLFPVLVFIMPVICLEVFCGSEMTPEDKRSNNHHYCYSNKTITLTSCAIITGVSVFHAISIVYK